MYCVVLSQFKNHWFQVQTDWVVSCVPLVNMFCTGSSHAGMQPTVNPFALPILHCPASFQGHTSPVQYTHLIFVKLLLPFCHISLSLAHEQTTLNSFDWQDNMPKNNLHPCHRTVSVTDYPNKFTKYSLVT
jgi:hypothetical protein